MTRSRHARDPLRLDYQSPVPLHAQVERLLRDLIVQPKYQQGELLPDEVSLSRQLGISRSTVRAGINRLMYEGLLKRKRGVGTSVNSRPVESGISQWPSFTHEMKQKGISVETFAVKVRQTRATGEVARALKIGASAKVLQLDRLRGWDGKPVVHFRSFLPAWLGLSGKEDFSQPLYEIIERHSGAAAVRSHETLRAVAADARMSEILGIRRGTPLLQRSRIVFSDAPRPIEYVVVHYVSDRFALTLDLRRNST